jgi:RNA polymerase sigma-70 factor (ECF subfamily)
MSDRLLHLFAGERAVSMPSTHISLLCDIREDHCRDEAWAAFHARYHDVILNWCVRRGLPRDDTEDLTQDVLLKLFRQLPTYNHDPARGQFRGWLKVVVNNALTDFWRQRRPESAAVGGTTFLMWVAEVASPEAAIELSTAIEDHARTIAAQIVERVRAKLKETTWQAFYQTMIDERPAAEVAAGLNLHVTSVYKATYRVKQMLLQEYRHVHLPGGDPSPVSGAGGARETPA